jgi:hypothetical protein
VTATAITQDLFTHERLLLLYTRTPGVFWRHDVDVSLTAAVQMARFAKLAGARCTFCVMARSEFYNPFSAQGERALLEIKENGHKLAAHVDLSEISNPRFAVVRDLRLWDEAYPTLFEDDYIAFHMPPRVSSGRTSKLSIMVTSHAGKASTSRIVGVSGVKRKKHEFKTECR